MIIVEGPDGAGKTTLINMLANTLDFPVAPRVVSKEAQAMTDLREWVDDNLAQGFQATIFDRHRLISEPIYGPILRVEQEDGFNQLTWMNDRIKRFYQLDPIIIYCLPSLEEVRKNLQGDPDNFAVVEFIEPIYTAYVARASLGLTFSPESTWVWDYKLSPTLDNGLPYWFKDIQREIATRLQEK